MSRSRVLIVFLVCSLALSNMLWAYNLSLGKAPQATTHLECEPGEQSAEIYDQVVTPLIAAVASSAKLGATKDKIVTAASAADAKGDLLCMEDHDVVRVRGIGLKFDSDERLIGATATLCPP